MTELVRSVAADAQAAEQAIVQPPPVSWQPQTVGWDVLAVVLGVLAIVLMVYAVRRYRRNRYRRDALAELGRLERNWVDHPEANVAVLVALPALVKRCALSAWPRELVAGMSGVDWANFLVAHSGHAAHGAQALAPLVREIQYHDATTLARIPSQEVTALLAASRQWIEGHVPA